MCLEMSTGFNHLSQTNVMYRVRHLARAHGKSLQVLMHMSLALLSNHAISRHLPFFFLKKIQQNELDEYDA